MKSKLHYWILELNMKDETHFRILNKMRLILIKKILYGGNRTNRTRCGAPDFYFDLNEMVYQILLSETVVAHMVKNSSFYIQRKFYFIQRNIFIFRENFNTFREIFSYSECIFSIFREIAYLKKLFYIQRKL